MPTTPQGGAAKITAPQRIGTKRLVLRPWQRTDAPLLKAAIDTNLEHLRAFMPWAAKEPSTLPAIENRIELFDRRFRSDSEWSYAIYSEGEKVLYGGASLHRSTEKGAMEIGFWLQKSWTKQGFATEVAKSLADVALGVPGVDRVQIRCDERNATSGAVAQRAGFVHAATLKNHVVEPGAAPRTTVVWEMWREGASRPLAGQAKRGFWGWLKSLFG